MSKIKLFTNLKVRTVISFIALTVVGSIFFIPCLLLVAVLPRARRARSKIIFWLLHMTYWGVVRATFLPIRISGEQISQEPTIIIANHQSALDIPVVGLLCKRHPHFWFVLDYYAHKPFLGFFIRRMTVLVSRTESARDARALITGISAMQEYQQHAIIFPEGTRHEDGKVHEFKGGFALLARKTKNPVVPVLLRNLGQILPPDTISFHALLPIEVIVGPRYYYEDNETNEQFVARINQWYQHHS